MSLLTLIFALLLCIAITGYARDLRRLALRASVTGHEDSSKGASLLSRIPGFRAVAARTDASIDALKRTGEEHRIRYQILTDNVAAAVILHEADGEIDWCSPFTEVLTGYSRSEIYQQRTSFFSEHVHEEDRELVERALAIVGTGEPFQCRYRFYHRSGMVLWLEMRTVPILDIDCSQYTALSVMFDVTTSVNNQLQVEQRNRDLHEFTYMLSHDLKAPLFTIKGMLGILREDGHDTAIPALREPLEYISKATERLEHLVGGVLELAKVSASEKGFEPVSLQEISISIGEDYGRIIREAGGTLEIAPNLPSVLANPRHMYQILSNLVGNAFKYRDQKRPLHVSISFAPGSSRRRVLISVRDNGRGIPEDMIDRLFKPFQRIEEQGVEGTGVGLACVKRLVEKSGGDIRVESAVGKGTCFTIELRLST